VLIVAFILNRAGGDGWRSGLFAGATAGGKEGEGAEQVCAQSNDDDLGREFGMTLNVYDRDDGEHDVEQGDEETDRGRDPQPERCAHGQSAQAADRNGEQGEIGDAVENPGGVVDELESFLCAEPELTNDREDKSDYSNEQDELTGVL